MTEPSGTPGDLIFYSKSHTLSAQESAGGRRTCHWPSEHIGRSPEESEGVRRYVENLRKAKVGFPCPWTATPESGLAMRDQ